MFSPSDKKGERKQRLTRYNMFNMMLRTLQMFEWKGLPETIPQRHLELTLQTRGHIGFIRVNSKLYAIHGGLGGVPNENYMPSNYIISNPYLKLVANMYNIYENKNVVVLPNDDLYRGLMDILSFHSELLTEINLTKRAISIIKRAPVALTAPTDNAKADIDDFMADLEEGEIGSIFDKNFLQNINAIPMDANGSHNIITQLLEMEQYQKAALFNDLGMQMNYNMKRETITSSEAQLGEGSLLPLPDNMLAVRKKACEELKEVFDVDISVDFSSQWLNLRKSIQNEIIKEENEAESTRLNNDNNPTEKGEEDDEGDKSSETVSESEE